MGLAERLRYLFSGPLAARMAELQQAAEPLGALILELEDIRGDLSLSLSDLDEEVRASGGEIEILEGRILDLEARIRAALEIEDGEAVRGAMAEKRIEQGKRLVASRSLDRLLLRIEGFRCDLGRLDAFLEEARGARKRLLGRGRSGTISP